MTQAFNLSQLANNLNSSGQVDATDGLVNAVPVGNGGTGVSTLSGVAYGNGTSAFTAATSTQLKSVLGTLAVGDGGTGATSFSSGSLLKGNGTSAISTASSADVISIIGSNYVSNATYASSAGSVSSISTSQVLNATAGAGYKDVGTYIFATFTNYGSEITPGTTTSGTNLNAAGLNGGGAWAYNDGTIALESGTESNLIAYVVETLPGTWRAMGCTLKYGTNGRPSTLWLRIS